jgi:hypothetical protein
MLFIPLTMDAFLLCGIVMGAFMIGFSFRSKQILKSKRRIGELEREMISNHAEILELQKEKLALELRLKGSSNIPVIPISSKEDKKSDNKSAGQK